MRFILIIPLLKLLQFTDNAALCAAIMVSIDFGGLVVWEGFTPHAFLYAALDAVATFAFFEMLRRYQDEGLYWSILVAGLMLGYFY